MLKVSKNPSVFFSFHYVSLLFGLESLKKAALKNIKKHKKRTVQHSKELARSMKKQLLIGKYGYEKVVVPYH